MHTDDAYRAQSRIIIEKMKYYSSTSSRKHGTYGDCERRLINFKARKDMSCNLVFTGDLPPCPRCGLDHPTNISLGEIEKITERGYFAVICPACKLVGPKRSYPSFALKYYILACNNLRECENYITPSELVEIQPELQFNLPELKVVDVPIGLEFKLKGVPVIYTRTPLTVMKGTTYNCATGRAATLTFVDFATPVEKIF